MIRAIIYLLAIIAAEVVTIFLQPIAGIAFYTAILIIVLLDAAQIDEYFYGRLVL